MTSSGPARPPTRPSPARGEGFLLLPALWGEAGRRSEPPTPICAAGRPSPMFGPFLDYTVNGLIIGNIYALLAVGLALIFGVSNLINFAHGSVYTVGAYIGWACVTCCTRRCR